MAELLIEITVSLTSTKREGMYKMKYYEWPISKETEKTLTVTRFGNPHRELTSGLNKIKPTRKNTMFHDLGFSVTCKLKDKENCAKKLNEAIQKKIDDLSKLHTNAIDSFKLGFELNKAN
tara:strand:- start:2206 stop:2565 length:360 start_codon:yes stop_codon:yes gene_type:complete